jgi:hypothetical protein
MLSVTKAGAEQWAFERMADGFDDVWIEDELGNVVVTCQEIKRRRKAEGNR